MRFKFFIIVLFVGLIFLANSRNASADQMTTDWIFPTAVDNSYDYTNPQNVLSRDGNIAISNSGSGLIRIKNFNHVNLPPDAKITNVEIRFHLAGVRTTYRFFNGSSSCIDHSRPGFYKDFKVNSQTNIQDYFGNYDNQDCSFDEILIRNGQYYVELVRYLGIGIYRIDDVSVRFTYEYSPPTPSPTPSPFLDLPWDYEGKNMSFTDAALSINSFFDHEYPLLGFENVLEPASSSGTLITYKGGGRKDLPYNLHNGYDYGKRAQAYYKNPVLAAAEGTAEFSDSCTACGNMIKIDHGNGYQTLYMHLRKDNLITATPGAKIHVTALQKIGEVGFTGHVRPEGSPGAHIHFEVVEDKNKDNDFSDNILDGLTDPFGWKSEDPDPWENYSFMYGNTQRTGNKSNYLWSQPLDGLKIQVNAATGGVFKAGRYSLIIPPNAFDFNMILEMTSGARKDVSNSIISLIPTMNVTLKDSSGENITEFLQPITLSVDFTNTNMAPYKNGNIFIYSSSDEALWLKENSQIDLLNKRATVQLNHLTNFALMGERIDTTPPTTNAIFSGDEGEENWFRSNIELALNTQDNEGGLGVEYTAYRIGSEEWQEYTAPLTFSEEGNYKVEFYSEDNDGNVEDIKTVEFYIDKTSPQVFVDSDTQFIWPPNGRLKPVKISGTATDDNLKSKWITITDEYNEISFPESDFNDTIYLKAKRNGEDFDGRTYTIETKAEDFAGNTASAKTYIIVLHDNRIISDSGNSW